MAQYEKEHATTVVLAADLAEARFVSYDGNYASPTVGGGKDSQGVSEMGGVAGDAIPVVTEYSAIVEAGDVVGQWAYVKPDAAGRAVAGSAADHCGRALTAATAAGQKIEVQVLPHIHP